MLQHAEHGAQQFVCDGNETSLLLGVIGVIRTPLVDPAIAARCFALPQLFWFLPVPPFLLTLALVFLGYSGLGISVWPNIIPPSVSIWEASSPPQSQGFTLVGALFILPVILMYTVWSYYVFRGKVHPEDGYH